ncbi:ABC transporter permease [Bordetella sp. BOR01]|uniref:ABC transporter permease n=1 Tax=Bordetella sp. BOR01 TaxID=2854779 RepID=UPI001C47544D|nr:ABC transporter permease [Bordetella sp. BOR01]MBV7483501.1 ABC transporter permease [Bordetella sp. BOR01]
MFRIVSTRIAQALPVMLIVAILTFFLMHMLPGDPAVIIAGDQAGPEAIEAIRSSLGLDKPLLEQLWTWLRHLAQGNFGESLILNQPVLSAVRERLPVTLSLAAVAFAITLPIGIGLGIVAAYWRNSWLDSAVMGFALLGVSVPNFWIATLSVILFSVNLGWLPSAGYVPLEDGFGAWLAALIQPAVVLALFQIGFLARMTRSEMLEILDQDYVRTARAKGVSEYLTVAKHAFRNTLVSVVTVGGYILSLLIGGSVVVEQVFALPGIGRLLVQAIMARDYPTVQGTMLLLGFAFVLVNVVIDLIYTFLDPRVRYD